MFLILAAFFAVNWLLGFAVMRVTAPAIHVLLLVAMGSLAVHLVARRGLKLR